jgi:hypothetical protein
MINLDNWLFNLVDNFTFYGGGGGSKGGGGKSETTQQLDPTVRPFVKYGLEEAKGLYQTDTPQYYGGQTYIGPSAQTQSALQAAQNRALQGNPLLPAAQQQQLGTIQGDYLSAGNPYFTQALAGPTQQATQAYNDAIKQAQSTASQAGRYGSGVSADIQNRAANTLATTLANTYGNLAYQNYAGERGMQNQAVMNAPGLAQADYADISQLANVGKTAEDYQKTALQADIDRFNFEQNKPYQKLSAYLGAAYGAPMGQVSTTTQSGGGGKIVCTAMNQEYGFGSFRNAIWLAQSKDLDPAYEKGYHTLFLPLVNYAYKAGEKNALQRILRGVLEHIARHRTADIWKQKRGKNRDNLGMIYRAILEPICYVVGKV